MGQYSIGDLESITGIKAHTIRVWEQRYGILHARRTDTNIRVYNDQDLCYLLNIAILNEAGVKISRIAVMSPHQLHDEVDRVSCSQSAQEPQLQALILAMVEMDEPAFERCISTSILQHGLEETMENLLYPFFYRIGIMWQTHSINPAQEHFISNLIRQKLIVAIDGQHDHKVGGKKFVLYLPEGEMHEISLLYSHYLIRKEGHRVVYLGQSLPFEDLVKVCRIHQPDFILTVCTSHPRKDDIADYLQMLGQTFQQSTILVSGGIVKLYKGDIPENMVVLADFHQLKDLIRR